jgi:hypothetical protein
VAGVGVIAPGRGPKPALPVAEVVRATLNDVRPDGATHWSTRSMARWVGIGKDSVARIWADHNLKPWKVDTFKLSADPRFEEKLVDVVGLYMNPPERAVVSASMRKRSARRWNARSPRCRWSGAAHRQ